MAVQLIADLYGCSEIINDTEAIKRAAHRAIEYVGADIVEECIHKFEPIGVTYFAVISTSHFSVHTWPEYGYAAVDIFSCTDDFFQIRMQINLVGLHLIFNKFCNLQEADLAI